MRIVEISPQKSGKVKISLEGGTSFVLYRKEAARFQLEENGELPEEVWNEICTEVLDKRAKKRAMHLLEKMDRTEAQLRRKLKENGYPDACIEQAVAYVKSFHYIDDKRYASAYIRCHQKQKSKLQLQISLRQKGVPTEMITEALEEDYTESERELILKLLEKKLYDAEQMDRKEKYKIYQYLMRRGFSGETVRSCMDLS